MKAHTKETEVWKWVVGYETLYKVSNLGRVKRMSGWDLTRCRWNPNRVYKRHRKARMLKFHYCGGGYPWVYLWKNGTSKIVKVHTLVLITFVGPRPKGMECRHLNDVKSDNRVKNLKWGTHKQNGRDMTRNGIGVGEKGSNSKLTTKSVLKIRALHRDGISAKQIASKYDVCTMQIYRIVRRQQWKHV